MGKREGTWKGIRGGTRGGTGGGTRGGTLEGTRERAKNGYPPIYIVFSLYAKSYIIIIKTIK